jgi:hypothetical protein
MGSRPAAGSPPGIGRRKTAAPARIEIDRRRSDIGGEIVTLTPGDPVEFMRLDFVTDFPPVNDETGLMVGGSAAA